MNIHQIITMLDTHQGSMMVLLTLVYVVATIAICIFNGLSTRATKRQIQLTEEQLKDINRPNVLLSFETIKGALVCFTIQNTGRSRAEHLKITFYEDYIEKHKNAISFDVINSIMKKTRNIMPGEKHYYMFAIISQYKNLCGEELKISYSYCSTVDKFEDEFVYDFEAYGPLLLNVSPEEEIGKQLKNINNTLKKG